MRSISISALGSVRLHGMGHNYCEKRPVLSCILNICNKKYRKCEQNDITCFSNADCLQNYGEKYLKRTNTSNSEDLEILKFIFVENTIKISI